MVRNTSEVELHGIVQTGGIASGKSTTVSHLKEMGAYTIDCDVLQADGGTRTAAITCAYVALYQAVSNLIKEGKLKKNPISSALAGVSIGVLDGYVLTDLCYEEDSQADVDFNIVMTDRMEFVEIQGTAEKKAFNYNDLESILSIGKNSLKQIFDIQKNVIHKL